MNILKKHFLILLFLFMPLTVLAVKVEPNYTVENVFVNAELDMIGSMHVREMFVVKGSINGYKRFIEYKNTSLPEWEAGKIDFSGSSIYNGRGISLSKMSAFKIEKDEIGWALFGKDIDEFEEDDSPTIGDKNVYSVKKMDSGSEVKIFNSNESGYIVFYFDYYVNQVAVLHNDIAELYYTFFKLDSDNVKNVEIQVTTPWACTDETFRVWAHGALNGTINPISDKKNSEGKNLYKGAFASLKDYQMGNSIEIRLTFDKTGYEKISTILDKSEMDAFESIIEIETTRANVANKNRTIIKIFFYGIVVLSILYLIGLILLWIHIYKKYDKEYKIDFDHKYYREFTGNYNVEVVEYLLNKNISTKAFMASIMNLIYKKNIDIEDNGESKKNITLVLKNRNGTNEAENKLLNLLFDDIGSEQKVTLKQIEKYSSKASTAEKFMAGYESWKLEVINDANKENFFESHSHVIGISVLNLVLGVLISSLTLFFKVKLLLLPIFVTLGGISFLIYTCSFKKWTKHGREHYLKWNAFKNFLLDFGSFKDKEVPEIKLWDKYLVYATVFGIAKEVQKAMNVQLSNLDIDQNNMPILIFGNRDFYMMNTINNSISSSYTKCINTINAANASSSMSSGGGFGGGFSGGGGGAGGGGGGGGF